MNEFSLEKYEQVIRGADFQKVFSESEQMEIFFRGLLKRLSDDASPSALDLIQLLILQSTDPELITSCFQVLETLGKTGNQQAIEILFLLALSFNLAPAVKIIKVTGFQSTKIAQNAAFCLLSGQISKLYGIKRYLYALQSYYQKAGQDLRIRMLKAAHTAKLSDWISINDILPKLSPDTFPDAFNLFNSLPEPGKRFFLGQLIQNISKQPSHFLEFSILLYCKTANPILKHLLNHLPAESFAPEQYALFLLFDGQWISYQQFDPTNKYIAFLYDNLDNEIRVKILQQTRAAGIEFTLSSASHKQKLLGIQDLSVNDWQAILQSPLNDQEYQRLWQLAQYAPPYWSAKLIALLQNSHWKPTSIDDAIFFESIVGHFPSLLSDHELSVLSIDQTILLPAGIENAVSQEKMLAYYSNTPPIINIIQDFQQNATSSQTIIPPKPIFPTLTFSPHGDYLLWADTHQYMNVYDIKRDCLVKRFQAHDNIIKAIAVSADQHRIFTTGFDGSVMAWRFPDGSLEKIIFKNRNEIYCMVLSHEDEMLICGDIEGTLHIFSVSKMDSLQKMTVSASPILLLSNPVNGMIASYNAEKRIQLWNYRSGRILNQLPEHLTETGKINLLQLSSNLQFLYIADSRGQITIVDPLSGKLYEKILLSPSPIMSIEPSFKALWIAQQNGNIHMVNISIWQQLLNSVKLTGHKRLSQLDALISSSTYTPQKEWLQFTKSFLQWQKRFDISIEELQTPINFDDYSITI
jgi:WD40 repeat protein